MVEIPGGTGPGPPPHLGPGFARPVFERAGALVAVKRIAGIVLLINRADGRVHSRKKAIAGSDSLAFVQPHIGNVHVLPAVVVIVEPAGAHARSIVLYACSTGNIGKGAVSVVAIEVLTPKIVGYINVWPAVVVIVTPGHRKTKAIVVGVNPAAGGHVLECAIAAIAKQEIGRPVLGVIVGRGKLVLIQPLVIAVNTEVNIQQPVAVVVCDRRAGEGALWWLCKPEGSRFRLDT